MLTDFLPTKEINSKQTSIDNAQLVLMKTVKETMSDSLGLRKNLGNPSEKKNSCQSQHVSFFLNKSHKLDRKTAFH